MNLEVEEFVVTQFDDLLPPELVAPASLFGGPII